MPPILVVTPLQSELDHLAEALGDSSSRAIGKIEARSFRGGEVLLAIGGHGKAQFAVRTQYMLDELPDVRLVICAGVAGGLSANVGVRDVVVGTVTTEHDFRNHDNRQQPSFSGDPESITNLKRAYDSAETAFTLHFGTIASGDEDIVDAARARMLADATGAIAVAWEGAGGARACEFTEVPYLELRGVSDLADSDFVGAFARNLPVAMTNVGWAINQLAGGTAGA